MCAFLFILAYNYKAVSFLFLYVYKRERPTRENRVMCAALKYLKPIITHNSVPGSFNTTTIYTKMGKLELFNKIIIAIVFLCGKSVFVQLIHHDHENNVGFIDPYGEILHFYNITSPKDFLPSVLEDLVKDFARKVHCEDVLNGEGKQDDHENAACLDSFCVDIDTLLASLGLENTSHITEESFAEISVILLEIAADYNGTCHTTIPVDNSNLTSYPGRLLRRLGSPETNGTFDLIHLQETLESLTIEEYDVYENDVNDHDEHNSGTAGETGVIVGDDIDAHDYNRLLFKEKCFGADVLFDQLGYDVQTRPPSSSVGRFAALVVFYIVAGAHVSRDCRTLPRVDFFLDEIYHIYGDGNNTIKNDGFQALLSTLGIGGSQQVVPDTTVEAHSHRRRRETGADDDILHKESWAHTCYTKDQILAVFNVAENGISIEKFGEICPALIQQSVASVCNGNASQQNETNSTRPTTAERYGYGTLAVVIVCLCSAIGAVVVKCASAAAYDVIIAIFLGLATGTLFADAFLHLIPTALNVHGHVEGDADHEEEGIVVETYVWISMATCAGVYVFYLFEKLLSMARGQHNHSHGTQEESIFVNGTSETAKAEKYKETEEEKVKEKSKPVSSIAIMVSVADAVHNIADGIAMGAAFSSSLYLGLSTSIAVVCHELPHELGDFAILLTSGLSFTKALLLNLLVSTTAIFGLYVGLAISEDETVQRWIVAVTAGVFLYISLVNMLPQLLQKSKGGFRDFVLNNIGILLGAGSMLILAIFEEKIRFHN